MQFHWVNVSKFCHFSLPFLLGVVDDASADQDVVQHFRCQSRHARELLPLPVCAIQTSILILLFRMDGAGERTMCSLVNVFFAYEINLIIHVFKILQDGVFGPVGNVSPKALQHRRRYAYIEYVQNDRFI